MHTYSAENEITSNEDIQELCYEALKDLFRDGGRRVIQCSKAWKIIEASLKVSKDPLISSHYSNVMYTKYFQLRTTLNEMDFMFVSRRLWLEVQNILH